MRILVTGGAGFIGFSVTNALLKRGDEVIIVDNLNDYYDVKLKKKRLNLIKDKVKFYQIDISDFESMKKVFSENKIDKVCHLAAQAGVRYSIENPFAYERTNNIGTLNILELMKDFNVKDLVYASSSSVYGGNEKTPFSVGDNVGKPISLYAATKRYNELMAHVYHNLYDINCFGLRFFTVYGPWGRPDMAYFKFTKNIIENNSIDVYNNGDHLRDFTYIDDIVNGVILSLNKVKGYELLNLGNNNVTKLMSFIICIEDNLGVKSKKVFLPKQKGDVYITSADIEHTKKILGWEPKVKIEEGINNFINWYKSYNS